MSSLTYDEGGLALANGTVSFEGDIVEAILVKSTYTPSKADTFAVLAAAEISGATGYVGGWNGSGRQALASKTIMTDAVNHRTVYDADDPAGWVLAAGDIVGGVIIAKKGSASDATAKLLFYLGLAGGNVTTNGSIFLFAFDVTGIRYIQH